MKHKIFLLDVLPGSLSVKEVKGYLSPNTELVVNMPRGCRLPSLAYPVRRVDINARNEREIEAVARQFNGFDALKIRKNVTVGKELLRTLTDNALSTRLKIIGQAGVGLNHIDTAAAEALGIDVFNTPGSNASAVAEFTLLQMLTMLRQTVWHQTQMRSGIWTKAAHAPSRSLSDVSVGLAGCGAIARALIAMLKPFRTPISVLGSSRFTDDEAHRLGVKRADNIQTLLNENDIISLHLPLTPETRYMINESVLPCLMTGSYLINTSRGGLIDEKALAEFMHQHPGRIAGVALDTFEAEGEQFSCPLQNIKEALLTPHIAGTTETALLNAALRVQQGILARLRSGGTVVNSRW